MKKYLGRKRNIEKNQQPIDFDEELLPEFEKLENEDQRQYSKRIANGEENVKPKKRGRSKKIVLADMSNTETKSRLSQDIEMEDTPNQKSKSLLTNVLQHKSTDHAGGSAQTHRKEVYDEVYTNLWQELNFSADWRENIFHPVVVYSIIFMVVLLNALWVVQQSFSYRNEYQTLNQLNQQVKTLETEWGKILIEKHTLGSSAQISSRATMQMGMFSPSHQQRVIVNMPQKQGGAGQ